MQFLKSSQFIWNTEQSDYICGAQAVELALELKPDVIVMDIRLDNGSNGIHAIKTIQQTFDL